MYDISFADAGKSGPVRRGTRKLLPPGYPKSNRGDRATKTAEIIGGKSEAVHLLQGGGRENFYPLVAPKPTRGIEQQKLQN